jgi:hypothetical protein
MSFSSMGRAALAADARVLDRARARGPAERAAFSRALSRKLLAALALGSLALAAGLEYVVHSSAGARSAGVAVGVPHDIGRSSLSPAARAAVSAQLGAHNRAYAIDAAAGGGLAASNPSQHLHFDFSGSTAAIHDHNLTVELSLRSGFDDDSSARPAAVQPIARANRLSYSSADLAGWYVNGPLGLEQGFTLAHGAGGGHAAESLTLAIAISGNARASLARDGRSVSFQAVGAGSRQQLRYGGLSARDAAGRTLRSWITLDANTLLLHVITRGARFPVTVDPLITGVEDPEVSLITPQNGKDGGDFGMSVSLSADGSTALIGAPDEGGSEAQHGGPGAAWVFTRSGGKWQPGFQLPTPEGKAIEACGKETAQERSEEETKDESPYQCRIGISVALSGNGEEAVVGAPHAHGNSGAVYIFTRSGSTWTAAAELTSPEEETESRFGRGVAISAEGTTVLVGAPYYPGHAWVFTGSGSTWSISGELSGAANKGASSCENEGECEGLFGQSVALSADGQFALVGAPGLPGQRGAAWVFEDKEGAWTPAGGQLGRMQTTADGRKARFGYSVALSASGETALIGARGYEIEKEVEENGQTRKESLDTGAAWVYSGVGTNTHNWVEQGKLTGAQQEAEQMGGSVALSASGETALVGAARYGERVGAGWLFERSGGGWGSPTKRLEGGAMPDGYRLFGLSVAISGDGETRLVGGHTEHGVGAAWVFGPNPAIEAVTPNHGPSRGGTSVTITGEHLSEATAVRFGTSAASFTVTSSQSITAVSPAGAGNVEVSVETPVGTSAKTSADLFTYESESGGGDSDGGSNPGATNTTSTSTASTSTSTTSATGGVLSFGPVSNSCSVSLLSKRISVQSNRRALLKLRAAGDVACKGKLTLEVKIKLAKKHTKIKAIGAASFSLLAGKTAVVKLKLTAYGAKLLASRHGRLGARLLIAKSSPVPAHAHIASVRLIQLKAHNVKKKA